MLRRTVVIAIAAGALVFALGSISSTAGAAAAKGGKVTGCVAKKGELKGYVRITKRKCAKGEKKVVWSKKGKRGKQGPEGPKGQDGKDGTVPNLDELLAQLQSQASLIQGLTGQVQALCSQVATVTNQINSVAGVVSGLGLDGIIPVGLLLDIPTLPTPLGTFGCP